MNKELLNYFSGDNMASDVWADKYGVRDLQKRPVEKTPEDMHRRLAKEFAGVEFDYADKELKHVNRNTAWHEETDKLSEFGRKLLSRRTNQSFEEIETEIFGYFDRFKHIVPQGSIMSNLGNKYVFGSLSNCFGIEPPYDSYGGIMRTDEHLAQLMKRRGGVGTHLNNLRHTKAFVSNASKSSTGVPSYAERYSNTTREVAQEGRRGALMLLLLCLHPDIFRFAGMKEDLSKVTGANITAMFTEEFMQAVEQGLDFLCRFPVDEPIPEKVWTNDRNDITTLIPELMLPYNEVVDFLSYEGRKVSIMRIKAIELFDLVAQMAWKVAEPGVAFYDRVVDYCPEGVYPQYMPRVCNPCGEQWFAYNETCRLIALNLYWILKNHFETNAEIDFNLLYEIAYIQQRLGDDLVDLEVQYIDRILIKLDTDPEPQHVKRVEIELWESIRKIAQEGRRTGNGLTGLGDMLAALNFKYDSEQALATVEKVMKTKMKAELDCTIDMAVLRGTFTGWNRWSEFNMKDSKTQPTDYYDLIGKNSFFEMLIQEFPEQAVRLWKHGRRNSNWSTVAPTGTVSLMTQTTSGLEPLFKAYYIRRKKINPSEEGSRVDFTDDKGDKWQEYTVLHPKFKDWIIKKSCDPNHESEESKNRYVNSLPKEVIKLFFEQSPWYGSEADDISWQKRIEMQAIIQKYTSNAISSTINLPKDVSLDTVKGIYMAAWKAGLKGVTVYRDGSRSGVLITETEPKITTDEFGYVDAVKRPKELPAHFYPVQHKGKHYGVVVGLLNGLPFELFAFENPVKDHEIEGSLTKIRRGEYKFTSIPYTIENIEVSSVLPEERVLTRWVSMALRHGVNPKHIAEQVEKSEVSIISFAKVVVRILKKYIPDEAVLGEICDACGQATIVREEGCKKCSSCGASKC